MRWSLPHKPLADVRNDGDRLAFCGKKHEPRTRVAPQKGRIDPGEVADIVHRGEEKALEALLGQEQLSPLDPRTVFSCLEP